MKNIVNNIQENEVVRKISESKVGKFSKRVGRFLAPYWLAARVIAVTNSCNPDAEPVVAQNQDNFDYSIQLMINTAGIENINTAGIENYSPSDTANFYDFIKLKGGIE